MYKQTKRPKTSISVNEQQEGETIETKVKRLLNNGDEVGESSTPIIYTERKDGVLPVYNIRHNKWGSAQDAMAKVSNSYEAKRNDKIKERESAETEEIGD